MKKQVLSLVALGLLFAAPALAADGDATKGAATFKAKCTMCHAPDQNKVGPKLMGVVGRKVGTREDYRYSAPMSRASFVWDEQKLKAYIHDPQSTVKGTRMPFGGIVCSGVP